MHKGGSWHNARLDAAHLNRFVLPYFCCRREDIRSVKVTAGSLMCLISVSNDRVWFYRMLLNLFSVSPHSTSLYFTAIMTSSVSHLTVEHIYLSDGGRCFTVAASSQPSVWPFTFSHLTCVFKCFFCSISGSESLASRTSGDRRPPPLISSASERIKTTSRVSL